MIGMIQRDNFAPFGVLAGKSQGQIVCFRPGIDKVAHGQISGHLFRQGLGALDQLVVQEAIVGGQRGQLLGSGFHHLGMTVANVGDIVDAVKVLGSLLVVHILPLATDYLQRIGLVKKLARFANMFVAKLDGVILRHIFLGFHDVGTNFSFLKTHKTKSSNLHTKNFLGLMANAHVLFFSLFFFLKRTL